MDNFKRQFNVINMSEKVKYGQCQPDSTPGLKAVDLYYQTIPNKQEKVKTDWHREEKGIA